MDELRRLLAEATPGPWKETRSFFYAAPDAEINGAALREGHGGRFIGSCLGVPEVRYANAALIVALRNNAEALLAVADAAREVDDAFAEEDRDWMYPQEIEALAALRAALDALDRKEPSDGA